MAEQQYEYVVWDNKYSQVYHPWDRPFDRLEQAEHALDQVERDYSPGEFDIVRRPVLPWETLDGQRREEI